MDVDSGDHVIADTTPWQQMPYESGVLCPQRRGGAGRVSDAAAPPGAAPAVEPSPVLILPGRPQAVAGAGLVEDEPGIVGALPQLLAQPLHVCTHHPGIGGPPS